MNFRGDRGSNIHGLGPGSALSYTENISLKVEFHYPTRVQNDELFSRILLHKKQCLTTFSFCLTYC